MRMSLFIGKEKLFTRDSKSSTDSGKAWWLTAFQPEAFLPGGKAVSAEKLRMTGTIWFGTNRHRTTMKELFKCVKTEGKFSVTYSSRSRMIKKFSWG